MKMINNPILAGFNPDPSVLRVKDDYYIATSTFEWFPGVQLHHSKDLVHWQLIGHALTRTSQLDMRGNPDSGGVWAPCLSYDNGIFYLIYSDVKNPDGPFKNVRNYLVTAENITGPWSEPIYLNSSGFDPSLFHDDDGKKWFVNMLWDHRKYICSPTDSKEAKHHTILGCFAGIVLQQYSPQQKKLIGPVKNIFRGTKLGLVEGPHLYKYQNMYYLLTAEGGSGYNHAVTMARSKNIDGPYEVDPQNPILTSANNSKLALQKAGHASIVQTQNDDWYMVHLCGRPVMPQKRCILGRETAIQKCCWTDDKWLRLEGCGNEPKEKVVAPNLAESQFSLPPDRDDFDSQELNCVFNTLRRPADQSWLSLTGRPGFLAIKGRESLNSKHDQSLVARRITSFCCQAETCVEFEPENFQQAAGLVCYYNTLNYYYLKVSYDESIGKCLKIAVSDDGYYSHPLKNPISIPTETACFLRVRIESDKLYFEYSLDSVNYKSVGPVFDSTILSDEYGGKEHFTGAFVGMCTQDFSGNGKCAYFDYFDYCKHD